MTPAERLSKSSGLLRQLRIDKGSPCGAVHSDTCTQYYDHYISILYIYFKYFVCFQLYMFQDMYSFSYIHWLQLAAEYGGCSLCIMTSPLSQFCKQYFIDSE